MSAEPVTASRAAAPDTQGRWQPLSGGTAVWVFMAVEIVTFGLFLLGHAWGWRVDPAAMAAGQDQVHVGSGVIGTVFLLLGSGAVYQAVLAYGDQRARPASSWLALAAAAGVAFCVNKLHEYSSPALADVTLSTSRFWFGYLFLTGLHLLHVVGGVGVLAWLAVRLRRRPWHGDDLPGVEAAAAYWHLVDIVWILVFPIIYVMHP